MTLTIDLNAQEEARLTAAARRSGLALEELARKLFNEYLPDDGPIQEMRRRIRAWQEADNTPGLSVVPVRDGLTPTAALFQQWAEEDALMTNEDKEADQALWKDFQHGIDEARRKAGMRELF